MVLGKPEGLKHEYWKMVETISKGDLIIYEVDKNKIFIYSLEGHYDK